MTSPSPTFQILYFASASSYTHKESESLSAPISVKHLFSVLEEKYPGITDRVLSSCSVAVGGEYVDDEGDDTMIQAGEEVAIIPPVSSG